MKSRSRHGTFMLLARRRYRSAVGTYQLQAESGEQPVISNQGFGNDPPAAATTRHIGDTESKHLNRVEKSRIRSKITLGLLQTICLVSPLALAPNEYYSSDSQSYVICLQLRVISN